MSKNKNIDLRNIRWSDMDKLKLMGYAFFGQITIRFCTHPLTVLQTNMQSLKIKTKMSSTFLKIKKSEGIKGFYRGFGVSILTLPSGQIYLVGMEYFNDLIWKLTNRETISRSIGGAIGSSFSALYAVPLDIISQRKIMSGSPSKSINSIIKELYNLEGLKGFYRGYLATILLNMPSGALFWGLYNKISKNFVIERNNIQGLTFIQHINDLKGLILSGLASVYITSFFNSPLSVIRTRIQVLNESKGILKEARNIYNNEGLFAFFKGLTPRMISSTIFITLFVTFYESIKRLSIEELH